MKDTLWSIKSSGQCFSKPLDMMLQNLTLSIEKMSPSGVLLFCRILYRIVLKTLVIWKCCLNLVVIILSLLVLPDKKWALLSPCWGLPLNHWFSFVLLLIIVFALFYNTYCNLIMYIYLCTCFYNTWVDWNTGDGSNRIYFIHPSLCST